MRPPAAWSVLHGVTVTLALPLWLRPQRLERLVAIPLRGSARGRLHAPTAIRAAEAALRRLARLPASPWRNTCLYRAAAACVLLRRAGVPARLRIGVAGGEGRIVAAHAWVEDWTGALLFGERAGRPLERPGARAVRPRAGVRS